MKKNIVYKNLYKKGVTVLETSIALLISIIVISAGTAMFYAVQSSNKFNTVLDEMSLLRGIIISTYKGHPKKSDLDTSAIINTNILPNYMIGTDSTGKKFIKNPFNGRYNIDHVKKASASGVKPGDFSIEMTNVPLDACPSLADKDFGQTTIQLEINGGLAITKLPLSVTAAEKKCTKKRNNIKFTFKDK